MTGMCSASHSLFVVLNSRQAYKKGENECNIYLHLSPERSLVAEEPPYFHPPPPVRKFKASRSAGFSLCTERVQSITLSLIIHVTTSRAARALTLTPPNHYGATGLREWSTLICSEESYGDIFQPLCPHLLLPLPSLLPLLRDFKQ